MKRNRKKKDLPLASLSQNERENLWDDLYIREEGIILEFDIDTSSGKLKSLVDDSVYQIDGRELVRTKIELRPGDKVLFAPFEDSEGNDYARVIRIIELNT